MSSLSFSVTRLGPFTNRWIFSASLGSRFLSWENQSSSLTWRDPGWGNPEKPLPANLASSSSFAAAFACSCDNDLMIKSRLWWRWENLKRGACLPVARPRGGIRMSVQRIVDCWWQHWGLFCALGWWWTRVDSAPWKEDINNDYENDIVWQGRDSPNSYDFFRILLPVSPTCSLST